MFLWYISSSDFVFPGPSRSFVDLLVQKGVPLFAYSCFAHSRVDREHNLVWTIDTWQQQALVDLPIREEMPKCIGNVSVSLVLSQSRQAPWATFLLLAF